MLVINVLVICVIILFLKYCWSRRRLYLASWKLPGEVAFPLIGTSWLFWNTSSEVVLRISELQNKLGTPFGFWLGTRFVIYISEPEHVEIVINSSNSLDKGGVYKYVEEMIGGEGLFTLNGDLWKLHRRLLNPTVQNYKILNSFYPCFNDSMKILVEKLEMKHSTGIFNIYYNLEACSFDMFCKTTFGIDLNVQQNQNLNVLKTINEALFVVGIRIFQPWLQFEPLFRISKYYDTKMRTTTEMRSFIKRILRKRKLELKNTANWGEYDEFGIKRLRIFINEIIKLSMEEKCFSEDEMISESLTMLLAGYETSAVTVANIIVTLALYPEYQEKVYQEIRELLPHSDSELTAEDLNKLDLTERVIKESMRLTPTVPFITRLAKSSFQMGEHFVPAETELIISVFSLQRNKKIWGPDAEEFTPDRFLPENIETKQAYSYIPFSAGSRNCIGKKYAQIVIRMFVIYLVRKYVFSTNLTLKDLRYRWMIVMKLKDGYPVKIEKREKY